MPIGIGAAALIGGGLLGSAALSSNAAKQAGKTVSGATDRAADLQNQQFQQLLRLQMPSYNRAEGAAGVYGQALGLSPQMSSGGPAVASTSPLQQPQTTQSGVRQNLMTGGAPGSYTAQGRPPPWKIANDGASIGYMGDPESGYGLQAADSLLPGAGPQVGTGQVGTAQPVPTGQPAPQSGGLDIASQVMNTPGYQAQLDQGMKAIDRAAPLVGGMYSGRRMKALEGHGQQTFGGYYNDWLNRVGGIAGQAPQIAQNVGQAGMQNAQNMGNLMMTGANARAQGQQNSAGAWTGAIGTGIGLYAGSKGWFGR